MKTEKNRYGCFAEVSRSGGEFPAIIRVSDPTRPSGLGVIAIDLTHTQVRQIVTALNALVPERRTGVERRSK